MTSIYKIKNVTFNCSDLLIRYSKDSSVELSLAEGRILNIMLDKPNIVFTNEELESQGWLGKPVSASSLTVVISSLRKKIESIEGVNIKNRPRQGYLFQTDFDIEKIVNDVIVNPNPNPNPNPKVSTKPNIAIHLLLLILSVSMLIGLFMLLIPRNNLECIDINSKKMCSVGQREFSTLNILDDISQGETILKSADNIIILDRRNNIKMRFKND